MKVLIYSLGLPPFRRGGLVNYTVDLASQLVENGNTVDFLYPGKMPIFDSKVLGFKKRKSDYGFDCYELTNPLPVSLTFGNSINPFKFYEHRDKKSIRKFIKKISPDVVHFHTIMGLPVEFLEVLKEEKIKTVYTTHDYYGLCPKMLDPNPEKKLKTSKCSYDCMLCKPGPDYKKIWLMQSRFYQKLKNTFVFSAIRNRQRAKATSNNRVEFIYNNKQIKERYLLRKYYLKLFSNFDCFHFNSTVTKEVFQKYLPEIKGKVVPLIIKGLPISYECPKPQKYSSTIGFLGGTHPKKGFNLLKTTFGRINKKSNNFTLICGGSNSENTFFANKYVKNMGIIPRDEINGFYKKIDLLVVPSQWHETFGLVVLEAASRHIPVICSDYVGSKDLLPSNFVFHNKEGFFEILSNYIDSYSKRMELFEEAQKINIDTNFKNHVLRIQELFY